ncbi:MAG: serine--tRNA ligase [Verrucomicrobiota bacterium]
MLDIKLIREKPDFVRERLKSRGEVPNEFDVILDLQEKFRKLSWDLQKEQAESNAISNQFKELVAQKKIPSADLKEDARRIKERITELQNQIKEENLRSVGESGAALEHMLLRLPNLPHLDVPKGNDSTANHVLASQPEWGQKPSFDFTPKNHIEICERLKLVDFQRATKISGSGFLLYTNWGAKLERALIQFLLDLHTTEHGYTEVSPPFIVRDECMKGVGQFPKFYDQAYGVHIGLGTERGDSEFQGYLLYLVPTAEAPVANIHREEILSEKQLPIKYCAYSPCFRAEAGAAGVGTRGMIRVHQFDKVELIKIVKPENSYDELEKMVANAEKVLQLLGLHYRVVLLCTGDMGFASAKTYDIEVWAPGQGTYLEVSSCSNCEDFQSRRMEMRYKTESGENKLPHILNGSGTALARLFVALIETHQQADGSISIPAPLQPYLKTDKIHG